MLKSVRAFTAAGAILVAAGSASGQVVQEAAVKTANNTAELAQKLSNPVADMVSVPFQWPPAKADSVTATGKEELGEVKLEFKP